MQCGEEWDTPDRARFGFVHTFGLDVVSWLVVTALVWRLGCVVTALARRLVGS